ncbi:MAG: stage III sporulation protein AE [Clostridia bacterium]|nr:stage III sporulation protein AE [Clostridia bacterium]
MKRKLKLVFSALLLCFCLLCTLMSDHKIARAEEDYSKELNESILQQLNELDLKALEEYLQSLEGGTDTNIVQRLYDYIQGEPFNYESFFADMGEVLLDGIQKLFPAFACIAAITLLCGILSSLKSQYLSGSSGQMIFMIAYISTLIPILSILTDCFLSSQSCIFSMQEQMQIVFPIMLTLMAASGGTVSVAIYQPTVAFLCNTLVGLISEIVFPITLTIVCFSIAGHLFGEMKLGKFTAFFKSINKWIMGVGVSVFGLFFTIQGITSATYDGIARRAAKYAIGTGVPIVGGFLSGGFDLAIAGSMLIKNSLGNMSLFLLVSVLFEPLLLLIAVNILLRLTAAVTQPFGDSRISDFLGETADNLNYCTAGLLFTAFLYFVVILLIVCSSEAFF